MVVSDGVVYFPSEIYPSFGIRPFSEVPQIVELTEGADVEPSASGAL